MKTLGETEEAAVRQAKRLLERSGYTVSEAPMSWRKLRAVVEVPIRSKTYTEKDWVKLVESILWDASITLGTLEEHACRNVNFIGSISVKSYNRVNSKEPPYPYTEGDVGD